MRTTPAFTGSLENRVQPLARLGPLLVLPVSLGDLKPERLERGCPWESCLEFGEALFQLHNVLAIVTLYAVAISVPTRFFPAEQRSQFLLESNACCG